ncbi:MAG TPA: pyridoxamine 5'-phosphate oxidase family protein [Dehalococcoidia bacterium]|jgi:predicted pyridoxine 5'-phosphate oxidase superfamily flavin-nucleotide-binding protein
MDDSGIYHDGNRRLQDKFDSRRIADCLEQVTLHQRFNGSDVAFIENADMFFLATADADGWPDVSYKGGLPGFVQVTGEDELAFPCYDGNGMFKSMGNLLVNPRVGLLFVDFQKPNRMRVQGTASVSDDDPLMERFPGAQLIIRVKAERIFPNCPRYIHKMALVERSVYAPRPEYEPPVPDWKRMPVFRDALPKTGPAAVETED